MKYKLFLFLYGLGMGLRVSFIGQLSLSEILAFGSMPFVKIKRLCSQYPVLIKIGLCYALLFVSLMLSDMFNETLPEDYLRGWAVVIFSAISVLFLVSQLDKHPQYCIYYLMGLLIIRIFLGGDAEEINIEMIEENTNYFKQRLMGFVNPAILLGSYFLSINKHSKYAVLLLLSYAIFCLFVDARSNSLAYFVAAVLLFVKLNQIKLTTGKLLFIGIISLCLGAFAYVYYVDQVLYHDFGGINAKRQLNLAADPYNPIDLLKQGRTGTFIAIEAIKDRPIIGYGSWARDETGKYSELQAELMDVSSRFSENHVPLISMHSIIFTAWLWAGIGGFFSILFLYVTLLSLGIRLFKKSRNFPLLVIILPLLTEMVWNAFFSPFGHLRTSFPIIASLLIVGYYNLNSTNLKL